MLKPREIVKDVWWVGAVDWDRRLFDALIPLPDGTSYNAYLIQGSEKTALIDTVDPPLAHVLLDESGREALLLPAILTPARVAGEMAARWPKK